MTMTGFDPYVCGCEGERDITPISSHPGLLVPWMEHLHKQFAWWLIENAFSGPLLLHRMADGCRMPLLGFHSFLKHLCSSGLYP
jgi:hypothetical protein